MTNELPPIQDEKAASGIPNANVEAARLRLRELWDGKIPLVQTFWLYYVGIVVILKFFGKTDGLFGELANIFAILWAGFMVKPIIAAADRYTGDRIWSLLAKITAAIIGLAVLTDVLSVW
jgi:hypothetical protein